MSSGKGLGSKKDFEVDGCHGSRELPVEEMDRGEKVKVHPF